jgi:hypothetical protein
MKSLARLLVLVAAALATGAAGRAAAHPGVGIVMDGKGNVFFTDLTHVWKIGPDGKKTIAVRNVHTHELCLDAAGALYGEHLWYEGDATKKWGYRVWRLAADGTLSDVIPAREGFRTGYSFVRDGAGNMYWSEGETAARILKKAADGTVSTLATCGDCRDVRWMAATRDGTVLFIDGPDLRTVSPKGILSTHARDLARRTITQPQVQERHALMGVWTDAAGNACVARYGNRDVIQVAADGSVRVIATASLPWSPTGGLFAPNGDLWLLEYSYTGTRVRRIPLRGKAIVY